MVDAQLVTIFGEGGIDLVGCSLALCCYMAMERLGRLTTAVLAATALLGVRRVIPLEHLFWRTLDAIRKSVADDDVYVWVRPLLQGGARQV